MIQRKLLISLLAILLLPIANIRALDFSATTPKVTVTVKDSQKDTDFGKELEQNLAEIQNSVDNEIKTQFDLTTAQAASTVNKITMRQLSQGFANANMQAAHAGSLQGYQNYELFALSFGMMSSVVLPSGQTDPNAVSGNLEDVGDIYAGVGTGVSLVHIGLRPGGITKTTGRLFGPVHKEDLYVGFKVGSYNLSSEDLGMDESQIIYNLKSTLFGVSANWAAIRAKKKVAYGLFYWRGVSVGTGFIYLKNEGTFIPMLGEIVNAVPVSVPMTSSTASDPTKIAETSTNPSKIDISGEVYIDPTAKYIIDTTTMTIPFDVTTSIQFLWLFNLNLGLGVDLAFGSMNMSAEAYGDGNFREKEGEENQYLDLTTQSPSDISIDGDIENGPNFVRFRITTGVGINLGPVKIDLPVAYYPGSDGIGLSVGLTTGIVW